MTIEQNCLSRGGLHLPTQDNASEKHGRTPRPACCHAYLRPRRRPATARPRGCGCRRRSGALAPGAGQGRDECERRESRNAHSLLSRSLLVRSRQSPALLSLSHSCRRRTSFSRSCQEPPFWTTQKIFKIDHFRPKVVQMSQIDQIWSWRGRLTLQKARLTQSSLRAWSTSRTRLFSRSRRPRSRQSPALLSLSRSGAPAALVSRIFANLAREKGGSRALVLPCSRPARAAAAVGRGPRAAAPTVARLPQEPPKTEVLTRLFGPCRGTYST